jgi:hypothetical protein
MKRVLQRWLLRAGFKLIGLAGRTGADLEREFEELPDRKELERAERRELEEAEEWLSQAVLTGPGIMRQGKAKRVIFFYPSEEGTYVDNVNVTLYDNGTFHIQSELEDTTAHVSNAEILWSFVSEAKEEKAGTIRLLKPSREGRVAKGAAEETYSSIIQKEMNEIPPGIKTELDDPKEKESERKQPPSAD